MYFYAAESCFSGKNVLFRRWRTRRAPLSDAVRLPVRLRENGASRRKHCPAEFFAAAPAVTNVRIACVPLQDEWRCAAPPRLIKGTCLQCGCKFHSYFLCAGRLSRPFAPYTFSLVAWWLSRYFSVHLFLDCEGWRLRRAASPNGPQNRSCPAVSARKRLFPGSGGVLRFHRFLCCGTVRRSLSIFSASCRRFVRLLFLYFYNVILYEYTIRNFHYLMYF